MKRFLATETLAAGVCVRGLSVPFEPPRAIQIESFAKAEGGLLSVFAPEAVRFPGVGVTIRVHGGNKDPVELLKEIRHVFVFAIFGDEGVGYVVDRTGADPFPCVRTAGHNYGFTLFRGFLGVCRVYADTESRNVATFVGEADVEHTDVRREERLEEAHPGGYDGEGLVILEEYVGLGGRPEAGAERPVVVLSLGRRVLEGEGWV